MCGSVGDLRTHLLQLIEQLPTSVVLQNKNDAITAAGELIDAWRSSGDTDAREVVDFIHQAVDLLDGAADRVAVAGELISTYANGI
ncbi:hypothetical protein [Allokutzneria oryzae]|uniref:Uncharacterized protein n=1 Tax=Allokutzneria oryzae TaxID=1378989 RepID=A0ABV5ZXJ2_9PSEU